ncbi:uncharacterized protein LOC114295017 [Camellia sinensis]|nr:uncharacterized protein LOC114295017 [Camellia sinensis]
MITVTQYKTRTLEYRKLRCILYIASQKLPKRSFITQSMRVSKTSLVSQTPFEEMQGLGLFSLVRCFNGCRDHTQVSGHGTRIWNLSDKPVELQIRVGSILKRVHTLKPGSSKRLKCKSIYKAYMPSSGGGGGRGGSGGGSNGGGVRSLLYYYDETCHPYIWIHETVGNFSRMVKQQYISLEDLRDCSEIRIFRDHQRGCISVRKKVRPEIC